MSDFDAYRDDMERISRLSDQEIDRLLAGKAPAGDADLEELAAFVQDVETLFKESPTEETAARQLAAIAEAAHLLPVPADRERSGHPRFRVRSKPMRAKLVVASAGLLLVMAFGGAAYAGALPGSVQGTVADLVGSVGVTLPGEDADDGDGDDFDGDVNNVDEGDKEDFDDGPGAVDESPVDDIDDDSKGDVDDDQQGDVDDDQGDDDQGDDDQGDDDQGDDDQGDDDDQGEQEDADEGDPDDRDKADRGDREDGDQGDEDDGDEGSEGGGVEGEGGDE